MARLRDIRERIHQPQFDSLIRAIGTSALNANSILFGNAQTQSRATTNLQTPGQLASDSTYILKAVRAVACFVGLNDPFYTVAQGTVSAFTNVSSTAPMANDMYTLLAYGCNVTVSVGQKPMFNSPFWYMPAGGGPSGFTTTNNRSIITNGVASQEAILKLAKDIPITVRQAFSAQIEFFPYVRSGNGQNGSAINQDLNPLDELNQFDGLKIIQIMLDGVLTRKALKTLKSFASKMLGMIDACFAVNVAASHCEA